MAGEMSRHDVTPEAYPMHFAVAAEVGGTVEPFDQYRGPYISCQGGSLWLIISDEDDMFGYWFNEHTETKSEPFPLYLEDPEYTISTAFAQSVA